MKKAKNFFGIPEETREALLEWYNIASPSKHDLKLLLDLYNQDRFCHWNCPECGGQILVATPYNWDNFQGTNQSEHYGELRGNCTQILLRLKEYAGE